MRNTTAPQFVVCTNNDDYAASLEIHKIYRVLPDPTAAVHHYLRVIDESGEAYLYPEDSFLPIELPKPVEEALLHAS